MRVVGAALEFGVVLHRHAEAAGLVLDYLDQSAVRRLARQAQADILEVLAIGIIELIPVAMALGYVALTVNLFQHRARLDVARICAQTHSAALGQVALLVRHKRDYLMRAFGVELGRV